MRRLFRPGRKGPTSKATDDSSVPPTITPSTKPLHLGINLLHEPVDSIVEYVNAFAAKGESCLNIIFVHGLNGHREKSWRANHATDPWPRTLLPAEIPNARILTFGHPAYVANWRGVVSQNRIGDHAINLLNAIATYREDDETNDRPIIFVAHSLGGLICEDVSFASSNSSPYEANSRAFQALVSSQQRPDRHLRKIVESTRGIIFLGTPHRGSGLSRWARMLAKAISLIKQTNPQILQVLQPDSEVLARIQESFYTMVRARNQQGFRPLEITCFFEELPLPVIGTVVPVESATLPGYTQIGIHSNHVDMIKFEDKNDPGFISIVGELRRWVKELGRSNGVEVASANAAGVSCGKAQFSTHGEMV
ncbi:MAG: hypothetical protein M1840_001959 [Geoglossum simile]|nr:MAG: hypothetical protein M1840_001959 [Geoglossum simile]